jgi:AcrR family transcriptional regulator
VYPVTTRKLSTAEDRREHVLETAMAAFADRGFHGTSTERVAKAAGISHAYLHKLFPTKSDLAVAVTDRSFERTHKTFAEAAIRAADQGDDVLDAMGIAYAQLVSDPSMLLVQLHAHTAAVTDPEVRKAVRRGFAKLYDLVAQASLASDDEIKTWFAHGMLINVLMAMGADTVHEPWAHALTGPTDFR